jgi:hypothetical protein
MRGDHSLAALRNLEMAAPSAFQQTRLGQVSFGPMNPVTKQGLLARRQKLRSFIWGQMELFGQAIDSIADADLTRGGNYQHWEHKRLIIRN